MENGNKPAAGQDIELRSEEMQEIMGKVPSWIVRRGIMVVFIVMMLFIVLSTIIKYPYVIYSRVVITTKVPPLPVVSKISGRIFLLVKDQQQVKPGDILGGIDNPVKYNDVVYLKQLATKITNALQQPDIDSIWRLDLRNDLNLGELQPYFSDVVKNIQGLRMYTSLDLTAKELQSLGGQLNTYGTINESIEKQLKAAEENKLILAKRLADDSILLQKKVISNEAYLNSKQAYFQALIASENSKTLVSGNIIQSSNIKFQLLQLNKSKLEKEKMLLLTLSESVRSVQAKIADWESRYLLTAPMAGTVNMLAVWANEQLVSEGQQVIKIIPPVNAYYCQAVVPTAGSGKLALNQRVNIKLDNFPFTEYGSLTGRVESISLVPVNNNYIVTISLPNGLASNYKKIIPFKQEMQGSAEIITSNLSISDRIFSQLISILNKANVQ
ncbi:HlyD family secretion protein [Chitinophaga sp.]|uniref:HlyD family secretion protein n=1 Tax=Chitinophaga sp. TaxID=1869181 RepID=UPI002F95139B